MQADPNLSSQPGQVPMPNPVLVPFEPIKVSINYTRQSSRLQDRDVLVQEKAMARKAISKGITSSSTLPISDTSCSLDTIARVCGFSLGNEEATRIANISLIQAKEDAMAALLNTKQKNLLSSTEDRDQTVDESTTGQYPLD